ncbi:hypothetical protein EEAAV_05710 [Rahnella aceris]|uniref:Uncharacterized protein n=1 Tax=Rahnella sp. (strain Y9602) TaxID=2703885 RepID=A0ABW6CAC9_RAHSY|nr:MULTISPECIES: hypothetical protein [Rahnella]MDP9706030.1 hypothetical protein [Rahnella aquatilis]UNK55473.1 hypothetical protein MNO10_15655 [Rahnella aceris]
MSWEPYLPVLRPVLPSVCGATSPDEDDRQTQLIAIQLPEARAMFFGAW